MSENDTQQAKRNNMKLDNPIEPPFLKVGSDHRVLDWRSDGGATLPVARHLREKAKSLVELEVQDEDQVRRSQEPEFPYIVKPGLVNAINVALTLGKPLLVTGAPGTGKTQLANFLAQCLDLGQALVYTVKSSTEAKDLFYHYDAMQHFNDIHLNQKQQGSSGRRYHSDAMKYIRCEALGKAILMGSDDSRLLLTEKEQAKGLKRSLVLIDEIDKAPRDVPNDILTELENLSFDIREINRSITAQANYSPIIIFASNSEKALPPAFLRRCVYYHIDPLNREEFADVFKLHFKELAKEDKLLSSLLNVYDLVQSDSVQNSSFMQRPMTAKFLESYEIIKAYGFDLESKIDHLSQPGAKDNLWLELLKTALLVDKKDHAKFEEIVEKSSLFDFPRS